MQPLNPPSPESPSPPAPTTPIKPIVLPRQKKEAADPAEKLELPPSVLELLTNIAPIRLAVGNAASTGNEQKKDIDRWKKGIRDNIKLASFGDKQRAALGREL